MTASVSLGMLSSIKRMEGRMHFKGHGGELVQKRDTPAIPNDIQCGCNENDFAATPRGLPMRTKSDSILGLYVRHHGVTLKVQDKMAFGTFSA